MLAPILTKVLVAENDPALLDTLRANLSDRGYQVLCTHEGHNVLPLARRQRPDVILLDPRLPQLDGVAVCRDLRRESEARIVLLAAGDQDLERHSLRTLPKNRSQIAFAFGA